MAYSRLQTAETNQHYDHVLQVKSDSSVTLPEGFLASQGGYEHAGNDLIISGTNGQSVLLQDFFSQHPSGIEQGSGFIPFDLAAKLAGPQNPGEYAQATPSAVGEGIGQIETAEGVVTAVHADGTTETLQVGSPIFQGDVIRTASGASVGITFKDESSFSLDEGGEITLDEMVYDPDTQDGAFSSTLTSGVFSFVSGQIAKANPDAMTITTPVATIGIRGTHGLLKQILGGSLEAALLEESGGITGELSLTNSGGTITLNQPNQFSAIVSFTSVPGQPITLSSVQLTGSFGAKVLRVLNAAREHAQQRIADEQAQAQGEGDTPPQGEGDAPPAEQGDGQGQDDVQVEPDGAEITPFDIISLIDDIIGKIAPIPPIPDPKPIPPKEIERIKEIPLTVTEAISNLDAILIGTAGGETLTGTAKNEGIVGLAGNDTLIGNAGNDIISGGSGVDNIKGGAGNDFIHGDSSTGLTDFKDINSYLSSDIGSDGNDTIYGDEGNDVIYGGAGNDSLYGGVSIYSGQYVTHSIVDGNDTIYGGTGNDTIYSGEGSNYLDGGADDDLFEITLDALSDVYVGGTGIDKLDIANAMGASDINVTLTFTADGAGNISYADTPPLAYDVNNNLVYDYANAGTTVYGTDTFSGIESVKFGAGADIVKFDAGLYNISSLPTLDGGQASDTIFVLGTSFDMTSSHGAGNITNFEILDLTNTNTALIIDGTLNNTGTKFTVINGGAGDSIDMSNAWGLTTADNGSGYQVYSDGIHSLNVSLGITVTNAGMALG